jgi:hypothetical protein
MDFSKDYYAILEVNKDASKEEVKAAYRKLALQYHPDRNRDDSNAEEKIKLINEAYEILGDAIKRHIYDEYKNEEAKLRRAEELEMEKEEAYEANSSQRRTYYRKYTKRKESRIYVRGEITVKYWAELEGDYEELGREQHFKVEPYQAEAIIYESDVYSLEPPIPYSKAYSSAELFKAPIPQPVKCQVDSAEGVEHYLLSFEDIRIINPQLSNVNKFENQSFGVLSGDFFAYVLKVETEEIEEPVTECFGETGSIEKKEDGGTVYIRREYYHKNCTRYWGPWQVISKNAEPTAAFKRTGGSMVVKTTFGCLGWLWVFPIIIFLLVYPQAIVTVLAFFLIIFLFSIGAKLVSRILPFIALIFVAGLLYAGLKGGNASNFVKPRRSAYDSLGMAFRDTLRNQGRKGVTKADTGDVLIGHFIRWRDYDSNSYQVTLSVLASDVRSSGLSKDNLQIPDGETGLSTVYRRLSNEDESRMGYVFRAFDSIRLGHSLDDLSFSGMIVSCVQSIPYYLILPKACDANQAENSFIADFLRQCNRDCCVPNTRFGLRTPAEFLSDLKGDCDTRALFLFLLFRHYGFDVALLTSEVYNHAIIAVNFDHQKVSRGITMNIRGKNYYLWETTNSGFRPGEISPDQTDLSKWTVALLNEKKPI